MIMHAGNAMHVHGHIVNKKDKFKSKLYSYFCLDASIKLCMK